MAYYFTTFYQIGWFSSICNLHGMFSVDTQQLKNGY